MQYRTRQEIYDIVKTHAQLQPRRSINRAEGMCAYRGDADTKCFIGALIDDRDYREDFDNRTSTSIRMLCNADIRAAAGIAMPDAPFACRLQTIHDEYEPSQWLDKLREVALENGLLA